MENIVLSYKDFTEQDLINGKDKEFIKNFENFYNGSFHIESKMINKKTLRVFLIAGY